MQSTAYGLAEVLSLGRWLGSACARAGGIWEISYLLLNIAVVLKLL